MCEQSLYCKPSKDNVYQNRRFQDVSSQLKKNNEILLIKGRYLWAVVPTAQTVFTMILYGSKQVGYLDVSSIKKTKIIHV